MEKTIVRKIFALAMSFAVLATIFASGTNPVSAEGASSSGRVVISMAKEKYDELPAGSTVSFNVYRIGYLDNESETGWSLYPKYASCDILKAGTNSERARAISQAQSMVGDDTPYCHPVLDDNGVAELRDLPLGIYLFVPDEMPEGLSISPYCISVPSVTKLGLLYDIQCESKTSYDPPVSTEAPTEIPVTDEPTETPTPVPTEAPTEVPVTDEPTPTVSPTAKPTARPTLRPTSTGRPRPTPTTSGNPSATPTETPVPPPAPTETPTISVHVTKVWNDNGNESKRRPAEITVVLYANNEYCQTAKMSGAENAESWVYAFKNLPVNDDAGNQITYSVRETAVAGYDTNISGTTITNTLIMQEPKRTTLSGQKTWSGDTEDSRPQNITVHLVRDGEVIQTRTVTQSSDWSYTFENLPVDDGYGHTYEYKVKEDPVPGYFANINGMNITNVYIMNPPATPSPADPTTTPVAVQTPDPTNTPAPTNTPEPTVVPEPTGTPEPTETPAPEVTDPPVVPPTLKLSRLKVKTQDEQENPIPDVRVDVTSEETGNIQSEISNENGEAVFDVEPGTYSITSETPNGYKIHDAVKVTLGEQDEDVDITYEKGSVLPETGSYLLVPLYMLGLSVILLSLLRRKKC